MTEDQRQSKPPGEVIEEIELLDSVIVHLRKTAGSARAHANYDADLIALRDAIGEAHPEDVPPLVEQMTRLQALAAQRELVEELPVDPNNPYFGHLRLSEDNELRDVLLGKRTYLAPEADIRIVDWRNAPVSRMYYSYDQGDEYEEEFGGRLRRGLIAARRSVTVRDGRIERVASPEGVRSLRRDEWIEIEDAVTNLAGGQGTALRAEQLSAVNGVLGVDADGVERRDKHLPEIAALLDREQFDLISSRSDGLMVVQGSAGSGKTTVGLHRIAYLAYDRNKHFDPRKMIVVTFNDALASYISRVLPALGVEGVRVITFERWSVEQRRRIVRGLPTEHSNDTPEVVSRLKKHPAMLRVLDELVDRTDERLTEQLLGAVAKSADADLVGQAWRALQRLPLDARRYQLLRWARGELRVRGIRGGQLDGRTAVAVESALGRLGKESGDILSDWADLFTDREALGEAFELHAPTEFSDSELDQVHEWCTAVHRDLDGGDESPMIDAEDEAILIRLHQLKRGWLKQRGRRLLHDHLMIDEVQDFSPIEVAVLLDTVARDRSITLAGDTAQQIVRDSGFVSWDDLLADVGYQAGQVATLEVAYRSTAEIMELSHEVLGPLAPPKAIARRHGAPVELHRFTDPGQAVGFLGEALRDLGLREPLSNVAVIARHAAQARLYYEGLRKAEVARLDIVLDESFSFGPGVEVTEVRQVKGLEFDYVILVEVNADSYPDTEESRHLLHVGATRAAHQLWLISTGTPSPVLPERLLDES